jgi:hypothetical protein
MMSASSLTAVAALAGAVGSFSLGAWAGYEAADAVYGRRVAGMQRDFATARAAELDQARAAEAAQRAEEQRRRVALQGAIDDVLAQLRSARADAADARAAADSLRGAADAAAGRCDGGAGVDSAAAAASAAEPGAGRVLADVLGELDERAGALAAALDRSRIAGIACERAYDSLTDGGAP